MNQIKCNRHTLHNFEITILFHFQKCPLPLIDISHSKKVCLHNVLYHIFACIFKKISFVYKQKFIYYYHSSCFQDEFISFLNNTKAHVQKECEILSDLKLELGKFVEKLTVEDNEVKE